RALGAPNNFAYTKVFDLSGQSLTIGPHTTLSYWIYPLSHHASPAVRGNNSTCVAVDLIFTDGTSLRDTGVTDQNGHRLHPVDQCGHLRPDAWNHVTASLDRLAGKTIRRIDVGYDQPRGRGGYRGYIDDLAIRG
ncbi:MAG: hypothetical protein JWO42_4059, partial [Chloroflexi bacterium]|nr:hypothetical protein [Chloroflexota bacterium]